LQVETLFVTETREKLLNSRCSRFDLLEHCYAKFDKGYFAGLCQRLSQAAVQGDQLSQWLFSEAGRVLAHHVIALFPQVDSVSIFL
jgi:Predicted N-acetylglucosamine kinase